MIKKIYSFFLIVLILVTSPFLIRYLLTNQKISILNRIYFNFPGIITQKKICPNFDSILNSRLDSSFSVSVIDKNGKLISSYNDEVLRLPASTQKLFSSAYVKTIYPRDSLRDKEALNAPNRDHFLSTQGIAIQHLKELGVLPEEE